MPKTLIKSRLHSNRTKQKLKPQKQKTTTLLPKNLKKHLNKLFFIRKLFYRTKISIEDLQLIIGKTIDNSKIKK